MQERLSLQDIYNALNPAWWVDNQQYLGGATWQSATVYWLDPINLYHGFTSNGVCVANPDGTVDPTTRTNYVQNILMCDVTRQIANTGCIGGITNVKPRAYQPRPIYGR